MLLPMGHDLTLNTEDEDHRDSIYVDVCPYY